MLNTSEFTNYVTVIHIETTREMERVKHFISVMIQLKSEFNLIEFYAYHLNYVNIIFF